MEPVNKSSFLDQNLLQELLRDGIAIQPCFKPEPLLKETGKGYYQSKIIEELKAIKEKKR